MAVPKIIGHRGAAGLAPENTLASVAKAAEVGCRWVEVDCKLSADGILVLGHDDTFQRTANVERSCWETPLYVLKAFDVGSWFGPEYAGEHIPTLPELVSLLAALNLGVNLEIKPDTGTDIATAEAVAYYVQANWPKLLPSPVISSFSRDALSASHEILPRVEHAMLWEEIPADWLDEVESLKADAVHVDADKLTELQCKAIIASGFPVRCYTVNDPEKAEELFSWGVEAIVTDFPDRFVHN